MQDVGKSISDQVFRLYYMCGARLTAPRDRDWTLANEVGNLTSPRRVMTDDLTLLDVSIVVDGGTPEYGFTPWSEVLT